MVLQTLSHCTISEYAGFLFFGRSRISVFVQRRDDHQCPRSPLVHAVVTLVRYARKSLFQVKKMNEAVSRLFPLYFKYGSALRSSGKHLNTVSLIHFQMVWFGPDPVVWSCSLIPWAWSCPEGQPNRTS